MHIQPSRSPRGFLPLLIGMLAAVGGILLPVTLLLVPACFAYAMCKTRPWSLLFTGGVFAALAMLLLGAFTGACFAVFAVGCTLVLYILQIRKISNAYTVAAASGVAFFSLYALVCLPGIVSGDGAFTAIMELITQSAVEFRTLVDAVGAVPADSAALFNETMDTYIRLLPTMIVPALCVAGGVLGLSNFLFFRLFVKKAGVAVTPLRAFRDWSIPNSLTTGLIIMLVGSVIAGMTDWDYAASLSNTVNAIVGMPLLLQGLCVLDFLLSRKKDGKIATRRVLAYVLTGLLFAVAQTPLIMLGCFDQLFHFRTRAAGGTPPMHL